MKSVGRSPGRGAMDPQLGPPGPSVYRPLILRMLRTRTPAIRRLGLETLRRCGKPPPTMLQAVAKAQKDPDAGVRCRPPKHWWKRDPPTACRRNC